MTIKCFEIWEVFSQVFGLVDNEWRRGCIKSESGICAAYIAEEDGGGHAKKVILLFVWLIFVIIIFKKMKVYYYIV